MEDILLISHDAMGVLTRLDKHSKLKLGSVGDPYFYIGAKLKNMIFHNGVDLNICFGPSKFIIQSII